MKLNLLLLGIVIFLFVCLGLTSIKTIKTREGITYGTPVTFNYTGGIQYWTCPDGCTKVEVELWGAQGGGHNQSSSNDNNGWRYGTNTGHPGGRGGYGKIEMPVTPGKKYIIYVGGEGKMRSSSNNSWNNDDNLDGGWPNGGKSTRHNNYYNNYYYNYYYYNGYEIYRKAGSGGGSTSFHKPGGALATVSHILAVAGGGGGSGGYSQGSPGFGVGMGVNFRGTGAYPASQVRGRTYHASGSAGQGQGSGGTMKGGDSGYSGHWIYRGGGGGGGINTGESGGRYSGGGGYYYYSGEGGTGYINPEGGKIKIKAQAMGIQIGTAGGRITGPQGGDAVPRIGNGMLRIRQIITHIKLGKGYCMPMSSDGLNNPSYKGKWTVNKERTSSSSSSRRCINPNGFEIGGGIDKGAIGGDNCIASATRAGCLTACKNAGVSDCSSPELPLIDKCTTGQTIQGEKGGNSFMTCNKCLDGYIMASDGATCKAPIIKGCANQSGNSLICGGCKSGYTLVDNKCKVNDIPNCADQGSPKGTECKSCGKGYEMAGGGKSCSLQPILGCKVQKGISCAECGLGHHYDKPPPSQNRCLVTPIKYCVDQRKIFCHECQTKWTPSEDRRTCKIIPAIKWCQIQRGKICETCVKGYTVAEDKISCKKDAKPEKAVPGKTGERGGTGPTGSKGKQGLIGPEGRPSGIGDPGWRGPAGQEGDVGRDGPEGNIGPMGAVGHKGAIGPRGPTTVVDPWANKAIVNSLKSIYKKIQTKNQEYTGRKNPPINLNIKMGHLGDGEIQSVHRSTETLGENIGMDIGNLNPAKDKTEDLSMLEGFNTYTYIR